MVIERGARPHSSNDQTVTQQLKLRAKSHTGIHAASVAILSTALWHVSVSDRRRGKWQISMGAEMHPSASRLSQCASQAERLPASLANRLFHNAMHEQVCPDARRPSSSRMLHVSKLSRPRVLFSASVCTGDHRHVELQRTQLSRTQRADTRVYDAIRLRLNFRPHGSVDIVNSSATLSSVP